MLGLVKLGHPLPTECFYPLCILSCSTSTDFVGNLLTCAAARNADIHCACMHRGSMSGIFASLAQQHAQYCLAPLCNHTTYVSWQGRMKRPNAASFKTITAVRNTTESVLGGRSFQAVTPAAAVQVCYCNVSTLSSAQA